VSTDPSEKPEITHALAARARFERWWTLYWATPPKMPVSMHTIGLDAWNAALDPDPEAT